MGAGHGGTGSLHHHVDSPVHRLPPAAKVLATTLFIIAVVATPRRAVWAYGVDLAVVVAVALTARMTIGMLVRRARIELPFVVFAAALPFIGGAPRIEAFGSGVTLSEPGLWAGFGIVAKGTLGVLASGVLVATTSVPEILAALRRLHLPAVLVAIAGSMVRYLDVLVGEVGRMDVARRSRGYQGRWLWQSRAVAAGAGALFVRSYERGERVHLAMLSRGFDGSIPPAVEPGHHALGADHHHGRPPTAIAFLPVLAAATLAATAAALG